MFPYSETIDPILMMDPPPVQLFDPLKSFAALSGSQNCWHIRNVPLRLISSTSSQSLLDRFVTLPSRVIPAQLTRIDATEKEGEVAAADVDEAIKSACCITCSTCVFSLTSHTIDSTDVLLLGITFEHSDATNFRLSE